MAVTLRLLDMLARTAGEIDSCSRRQVLAEHARKIRDDGAPVARNESDRQQILERFEAVEKILGEARASLT